MRRSGDGAAAGPDRCSEGYRVLDIRIPELSGLEVVKHLKHRPELVFTTAFDRFAIAAFELGALDYLLKPFGQERFRTMLERVRQRLSAAERGSVERARAALASEPLRRLFARTADRIVPIHVDPSAGFRLVWDYSESTAAGVPSSCTSA